MPDNQPATYTIGRLAQAAGVGVETVRYYQERALLPVPERHGGFRHYPAVLVDRIRFVKRAQDLGFTLDEIAGLLSLQDGTDRKSIRTITMSRLTQIQGKIADLTRMRRALKHLLHECQHGEPDTPCPIVQTLTQGENPCGVNVHPESGRTVSAPAPRKLTGTFRTSKQTRPR